MNPLDWLESLRENSEKRLIPLVPPEAAPCEKDRKAQILPETPCSSIYFSGNGSNQIEEAREEQREIYWGDEDGGSATGHRGNQGFSRVEGTLSHRVAQGDQENIEGFDSERPLGEPERPKKPFFTAGGDLSIPFDSDPKYH